MLAMIEELLKNLILKKTGLQGDKPKQGPT